MKMSILAFCAGVMMALMPLLAQAGDEAVFERQILEFETMVGVSGPFLGADHPLRGVNGGGAPWVLKHAKGELTSDGKLEVGVKGLIIPESAGRGFNPAEFFRAAVSCISVDADGMPIYVTVFTENGAEVMIGDPVNGDAKIEAELMLPNPCIAPIVFVTSPNGSWFAVTGFEMEAAEPMDAAEEPMDVAEPMDVVEPMSM